MTQPFGARLAVFLAALLILLLLPNERAAAQTAAETETAVESAPAESAIMMDARIVGDDRRVRFIADLSESVDMAVFTLADPYRIVVDLPEISFALPEGLGETGRGLISAFRYGLISPGKSRIVIDMTGPVKVDKSFIIPAAEAQPARLVIDVVPTTRDEFLVASRKYRETRTAKADEKNSRTLTPHSASGRPVIVIDPGHGGIDAGATGASGTLEKEVTLEFAKLLGAKLEETGLYDVRRTRTDDSFVALGDRVAKARELGAALFVSIHANSFSSPSIRGTVIYTVSEEASDKMAEEIAARENQSDVLAGLDMAETDSDEVRDILFDLTRRETRNFGVVFARKLIDELGAATKMFKDPHKQASFRVLEAPDVPSAMVELGYLSNPADEKQLLSPEWRDKATDSIVRAIDAYFDRTGIRKAER